MVSIWQFFLHETGWVAKVVLCILLLFSLISWAIIVSRLVTLKRVKRQNRAFYERFKTSGRISEVKALVEHYPLATLGDLFTSAYGELSSQQRASSLRWDLVERTVQMSHRRSLSRLRRGFSFLATTASATPFIGLFGTVWGIMNAFRQIGLVGSSSLATVAPGISEALINTAAGLFAAIPALIAYNLFAASLRAIGEENTQFADALMILLIKRMPRHAEGSDPAVTERRTDEIVRE